MKNSITSDSDSASASLAITERASTPAKRLRILLALLVLALVAWAATRPYIRSLKNKPTAPANAPVDRASALVSAGIEHALQKRWLEAVEILDTAQHSGADTAETHRILGRCLGELGWVEDTITEYRKAIEKEPTFYNTYISLATAYRTIGKRAETLQTLAKAEALLENGPYKEAPARYARPTAPMLEDLAEAYARVGEFPRSVTWATQAQTADPTRPQGYLLAAKSYIALQEEDKAIPLLQKASTLIPNDADVHYTLALALRARPSEPHNLAARDHLLMAIKIDPQHAPALFQYGLLCMERKEWDYALTAFQHAYELRYEPGALLWKAGEASKAKGDKMQTAFFLGQYYEYTGQLSLALQNFNTLLADPKHTRSAYAFIARTQAKMGQYPEAVATLEKVIALDPNSPELRHQLAEVYDKMHVVSKQTAALEEAAKLDPQNAHNDYYRLGKIALDVGKYDQAEQLLEKSIALNPKVSLYHYTLGQTYLLRPDVGDRLNKAIQHLEEAERLAPDSVYIHDFLSTAYIKTERWNDAAIALHRSANLSPQNQVLYFRLNQVYRRLGNEQEAKRAQEYYQRLRKEEVEQDLLSRRVKANPKDPGAHFAMGDFLLREQSYDGARREFDKALDLNPNDPAIHDRFVIVYGQLSQPQGQWRHRQQYERLTAGKKN